MVFGFIFGMNSKFGILGVLFNDAKWGRRQFAFDIILVVFGTILIPPHIKLTILYRSQRDVSSLENDHT